MAIKVVKNELTKFYQRLDNYIDIAQKTLDLIAKKGKGIASFYWANEGILSVYIESNGLTRSIIVEGEEVAFIEFGTGRVGEGTYKGKLPTETITFNFDGVERSTQGWIYYYDSPYKIQEPTTGDDAWVHNGEFEFGQVAEMPMYKTSLALRDYIKNELSEDLKKEISK